MYLLFKSVIFLKYIIFLLFALNDSKENYYIIITIIVLILLYTYIKSK